MLQIFCIYYFWKHPNHPKALRIVDAIDEQKAMNFRVQVKSLAILYDCFLFKDTLKIFDDFKNKQNSVWINVSWNVKLCILGKCIQYNIQWDKTQMLKNFLRTK